MEYSIIKIVIKGPCIPYQPFKIWKRRVADAIVSDSCVGLFVLEFYPHKITFIHSRQFTVVNLKMNIYFDFFFCLLLANIQIC